MAEQTFPWHPVALSPHVPAGATRAVILDGTEIVLWRGADGEIHAWDDRCPHRGMRLSYGFVRANSLNCLYHGWEYEGSSRCIRIPAHPDLEVPKSIRATAYAVHEAGGLVWMRLAGKAAADPPILPAGTPLISIAVDCSVAAMRDYLGVSERGSTVVRPDLVEGTRVLLAIHPVSPGKTMLHALLLSDNTGEAARQSQVFAVRELRRQAERLAEAA